MNATAIKRINKRLSNQKLVINAFSILPIEVAMYILEYIPIKIYFKPKELTFYKDHLLYQHDFQMIPDALRKNSGFMNKLIKRNPKAKDYVIEPMVDDDSFTIQFNQDQYNYYRKFALLKVSRTYGFEWARPRKLSLLCAELRDDKQVVLTAIQQSAQSFEYASDNLKNDKEVVLAAVQKQKVLASSQLKNASDNLKNDREIVLKALQSQGSALVYASNELKNDREIVLIALQQSQGYALEYASNELKNEWLGMKVCPGGIKKRS